MFVGTNDGSCDYEEAVRTRDTIGNDIVTFLAYQRKDHLYFWSSTEDLFMDQLFAHLDTDDGIAPVVPEAL